MNEQTIDLLNEIAQNTEMAKHTANDLAQIAQDTNLKNRLKQHVQTYEDLQNRACAMLAVEGQKPKNQSVFAKMGAKLEIKRKTLTDQSNQNLAQMLVKGNQMGVENMQQAMAQNPQANVGAMALAERVLHAEQAYAQQLKKYLS